MSWLNHIYSRALQNMLLICVRTDDCHAANELTLQSYLTLLFKAIYSFQWEVFVWLLYNAVGGYLINL